MKVFGLDIGSTSIKVVQLENDGGKFRLLSLGAAVAPSPGFASEAESDLIAIATSIKKLCQETKISAKNVITALPEGEVFTRVIEMPQMREDELTDALPWEAEQLVPRPLSEVTLDWRIIDKGEAGNKSAKMKVFLVAAPKGLIEKYIKVLGMAGLEPVAIETEMIAASRALISSTATPTLLLDFGAKTTDVAIVQKGQVIFTRSIPTAGDAFTRSLSSGLSLEPGQAEQYKRAYGLSDKKLEGKIKEVLTPVVKIVSDEIRRAIQSWAEKEKEPLGRLILTGGTANLPDVSAFLTHELNIEVQVADPFTQLITGQQFAGQIKGNACLFAVAVGLAQKEV
ncbi:MAG: type IV pilus assembly protein PilM [bacterium]|nr:type IV pilus assembly protein PilM [bacterium]